jgi:hypothetical protein
MATEKQQRFYQLPNGMWIDAMTGQRSPSIVNLKEALIEAASKKTQAQVSQVEKRYPEEYLNWLNDPTSTSIPKISDYSTTLNTVNEFGKILERPLDRLGVPKFTGRGVLEELSPTSYFGRGIQESRKGNAVGGIVNSVLAGASLLSGPLAGKIAPIASRIPFINQAPKVVKAVSSAVSQGPETLIGNTYRILTENKPSTPVYPYAQGNNVMTADQMERRAAAERNRTDAAGNSGMGGRNTVYTDGVRPPGGVPGARPELNVGPPVPVAPGAPIARVPMPALSPLSPEELGQYGQDLTAIDKLYKQTLADIAQEEEQGQLGYARVGQAAQRRAAGSAQDLANQMAGSSIGGSPAAAFGAEQMVQAPLVQQRQANRLNLDQLLAQLQKQRTQAGTAMDMSKVGLNRWMTQQQAANTRSQIESGYRNSLGGM